MTRELHDRVASLGPVLVISPHFDDAIFSCGGLLAAHHGSRTVTVFGGAPTTPVSTIWDRDAGFANSTEAVAARRLEDAQAHAQVSATVQHLAFCDSQYGQTPSAAELERALHRLVERQVADAVFVPLGLFHSDHVLVHDAALMLLRKLPKRLWIGYEDALYRRGRGAVQERIVALAGRGIVATPVSPVTAVDGRQKRRAVACYASQLRAFGPGGVDDLHLPERFWLLEPKEGETDHASAG
ncbi:PIG-L family deacetylase [Ralstonia pickettii]|uniref:PIG-L family deacetylase n=1 Tax=Ralstonia pickettii TaxID=329 RepID=A0A7X2HIM8_RALPI|nr:PIG-L family deacetylase [Ralstonia pickettii]MRS97200.1 PIG-L family deacetylase [Ralstonia pickettii]